MLVPGNPARFRVGVLCALAVPPRTVKHTTSSPYGSGHHHSQWRIRYVPAAPASAGATTVPAGASADAQAPVAAKPTPILFMDNAIRLAPFKQASYTGASLGSRDTPILGYSHGIAVQKRLPESEAHKQCLKDLATVAMAGDGCTEVRVRKARAGMLN